MPKDFIKAIYEKRYLNAELIENKYINRFDIFINNTFYGLIDCLKSVYSVSETLLGTEYFENIAEEYVKNYPMKSADRNEYGGFLPEFLKLKLTDLDFVIKNAELEWKIFSSSKAIDQDILSTEEIIQSLNNGNDLKLLSSINLLKSEFNSKEIYAAHLNSGDLELKIKSEYLLIWRDIENEVLIETIETNIFEFLLSVQNSGLLQALNEKMETLSQQDFAGLLQKGIFTNE